MVVRKKLSLVIGELYHSDMTFALAGLSKGFAVTAHVIQQKGVSAQLPLQYHVESFPRIPETPGYMRGLERSASSSDVIVCMNFGAVSSLQAARTAKEHQIPLIVYSSEVNFGIFEGFKNILDIQDFVISQASHFIVPVQKAASELIKKGVLAENISTLLPNPDSSKFFADPTKRKRFRRHIGVNEDSKVILFHGNLVQSSQPELLLQAVKLLSSATGSKLQLASPKIIFAGDGSFAKQTQYLAYELGLGRFSYFLAQDVEPFLQDLYCASDLLFCPSVLDSDELSLFPYRLFKAIACGVLPLVDELSIEHAVLPLSELHWSAGSAKSLSELLLRYLGSPAILEAKRTETMQLLEHMRTSDGLEELLVVLNKLVEAERKAGAVDAQTLDENFWVSLEEDCSYEETAQDVLRRVIELDIEKLSFQHGARAHCIRGLALTTLKQFESAGDAFDCSLSLNPQYWKAHYGAGFLAWHSYSHEEAMRNFKKGLALSPNNHRCLLGVALVYKRLGMAEDAIFWTEKAIAMGAKSNVAYRVLAQACNESKRVDFAIATLEKVVEHAGEEGVLMGCLGQLYLKAGYTEIGHQMLNKYLTPKLG